MTMSASEFLAWRNRMGYSRQEAADKLGKSLETIISYENNRRNIPEIISVKTDIIENGKIPKSHIHIFGGGTISHVRAHFDVGVFTRGTTAKNIQTILRNKGEKSVLHMTAMGDTSSKLLTDLDVAKRVDEIIADTEVKIVFFNVAMVDFHGQIGDIPSGKRAKRLESRGGDLIMQLTPAEKIINRFKKDRKDLFVVGFKTTSGETEEVQYQKGTRLLNGACIDLVLANDIVTKNNIIIEKNGHKLFSSLDREESLSKLIDFTLLYSKK